MSDSTNYLLAKLLVIAMCLQLFVIGYVVYNNYKDDKDQAVNLRAGCERSKLDRMDNADFQLAHSKYILKVTGAASVKEDVKRAAREARETFTRTSASLNKRAQINCTELFPEVSFP